MPDTGTEATSNVEVSPPPPPPPPPSLRELLTDVIEGQAKTQKMVQGLVQLNIATTKATFSTLDQEQRGEFCRSLQSDGVSVEDQAELTGKSKPTIYRYISS